MFGAHLEPLHDNEAAMRETVKLLVGMALLAGCASDPTTTQSTTDADLDLTPEVHQNLAKLRQVTAPFHDFDAARHAGWSAPITAWLQDPAGDGSMWYDYGKP